MAISMEKPQESGFISKHIRSFESKFGDLLPITHKVVSLF